MQIRTRIVVLLAAVLAAGGALAQGYPTKPIRLIVPFGAGGGSDYVGRLVGLKLTEQMGQTVVVDNRPGAASLVGTEIAQRAAADGYTLLLADAGFTINIAYYRKAKYDALKDFDPITVVGEAPYLLVANPALPYAGSLKEYIAAAKSHREKSTSARPATAAERISRANSSSCGPGSFSRTSRTRVPARRWPTSWAGRSSRL
jgi:tripartite-type tricarboxylate transporter receptor subunit TctC